MGRRSVNTTKSGKFMNPTDQARKEARKRELKKNKKQRMAVRHAVLKAKDPLQLLEETALYDKQEYDPSVQAQLNERVIQEKRRKLLETFDRLVILYRKEDVDYANRLQAARLDYDKRRHDMMLYYEQVKLAERVKASDIPLPKLPQSQMGLIASDIPLPTGNYAKSILKKPGRLNFFRETAAAADEWRDEASANRVPGLPPPILPAGRKPPGPPPGPPPELSDSEGEDNLFESSHQRRIRFADADPTAEGDSDNLNAAVQQPGLLGDPSKPLTGFSGIIPSQIPLPPPTALPSFTGLIRPGFPGAPQSNPPRFILQRPGGAVLSAPPSLHPRDPLDSIDTSVVQSAAIGGGGGVGASTGGTTIEAKPQLKNLIGDATRFVPTSLKVRRTLRDPTGRLVTMGGGVNSLSAGKSSSAAYDRIPRSDGSGAAGGAGPSTTSKDDAYEEFMREMEGLI